MTSRRETLAQRLADRARDRLKGHRVRYRTALHTLEDMRVSDGENCWVNFSGNDYLGLGSGAGFPSPSTPWRGSGASALVTGYHPEHQRLEEALARFLGREAVLLFSSGYLANLGVVTGLAGRGDHVVQDRLCHASLIDAARLSDASLLRYPHAQVPAARRRLASISSGLGLLVTDGVFSMDGDCAPLEGLARAARDTGASLVVDDAHGIGVLGPNGRGLVAEAGLDASAVPVLLGTLGKAFGGAGAFVAGDKNLVDHLVNTARSAIFSTAMPPAQATMMRQALAMVRDQEWRREALQANIASFTEGARRLGITLLPSRTPIQPLVLGEERTALAWSRGLSARGFRVTAIRPPTVPAATSRLRITLCASHTPEQVKALLHALEEVREESESMSKVRSRNGG